MATDQEREAYERGRAEGGIRERLDGHDKHFAMINGRLDQVAATLVEMTAAVARVGDRQQSLLDSAQATREALHAAAARRWSVWQRIFAVVSALAALVGIYVAWRTAR